MSEVNVNRKSSNINQIQPVESDEIKAPTNNSPNEAGKVFISAKYIVLFVSFVVVSTVLVGVLPALVDLPTCETETPKTSAERFFNANSTIKRRKITDRNERLDVLKALVNNPKNTNGEFEKLPRCDELNVGGSGAPWENFRLPDTIVPTNYFIILYTIDFSTELYSGETTISFQVVKATDTIVLNAKYLGVILPVLQDANGLEVELKCDGLYLPNDYYVIKTTQVLQPGTYYLDLFFTGYLNLFSAGLFEIRYNDDKNQFDGSMLASHFEPTDAQKAYPCFDEPQLKASYNFELFHPVGTQALTNMPIENEGIFVDQNTVLTIFNKSPKLPSYLVGLTIFNKSDFSFKEVTSNRNTKLRLWARNTYFEQDQIDPPLKMIQNIFNALEEFFADKAGEAIPPKIDVFAIPYYPDDAVPHYGLPIFKENRILFDEKWVTERNKQTIALLIAKQLSEIWFGNYVTFKWWDELWLQESLGDYFKYRVIARAYPEWRVYDQFITEELINVLVDDSFPSSHPVIKKVNSIFEIDQLFDSVETSKGAAILRMIEYEIGENAFLSGLYDYLNKFANGIGNGDYLFSSLGTIRKWPIADFADRWLRQSNYPLIKIRTLKQADGKFYLNIQQSRFNSEYSIFTGDLYPSPYNWIWFIPLKCTFGRSPQDAEPYEQDFDIDTKEMTVMIGDGSTDYEWIHCDERFAGYYLMDYSVDNWENLGLALKAKNENFEPEDRANIIHNLFLNAYAGKASYHQLVDVLTYAGEEDDYLPWRTIHKHASDMGAILEHKRSFIQFSEYFITLIREIEYRDNFWEQSGDHTEELKRETLIELSCKMQDTDCLRHATDLWEYAYISIIDPSVQNELPPHVRNVVYNYHFQNTYNVNDWRVVFIEYESIDDIQEREMLLEAITYTRLPWLLKKFLNSIINDEFRLIDFFDAIRLLSKNPLGRELCWDYIRENYVEIITTFGFENPSLGQMLLDVVATFEDEFYFFELLTYMYETIDLASGNARIKALEIVSTNVNWVGYKEPEIIEAFGGDRKQAELFGNEIGSSKVKFENLINSYTLKSKLRQAFEKFNKSKSN